MKNYVNQLLDCGQKMHLGITNIKILGHCFLLSKAGQLWRRTDEQSLTALIAWEICFWACLNSLQAFELVEASNLN